MSFPASGGVGPRPRVSHRAFLQPPDFPDGMLKTGYFGVTVLSYFIFLGRKPVPLRRRSLRSRHKPTHCSGDLAQKGSRPLWLSVILTAASSLLLLPMPSTPGPATLLFHLTVSRPPRPLDPDVNLLLELARVRHRRHPVDRFDLHRLDSGNRTFPSSSPGQPVPPCRGIGGAMRVLARRRCRHAGRFGGGPQQGSLGFQTWRAATWRLGGWAVGNSFISAPLASNNAPIKRLYEDLDTTTQPPSVA